MDKFRKSTMAKKTRLHWVSNKELQCSHWNIKPEQQFLHFKEKTVILFGHSFTSHHPVISTIKCQFLRGQLLIISCILRVQYLCRRFMHLYFTPWPNKEVKPLSYTGGVNPFEMQFLVHPSCIWVLLQSAHLSLLWFCCLLALLDDTTWTSTATKTFITLIN